MPERRTPSEGELFNPELATPTWRRRLKASEPGRFAAATYRRRRIAKQLLRAPRGPRVVIPHAGRRTVRCVVWAAAGPGELEGVLELWRSVVASAPGEVALLVTDDWTPDAHVAAIHEHVPDAVVARPRLPTGGPPQLWPITRLAIGTALRAFDFDLLMKLDADALVVGPRWVDGVLAGIARAADEPPVAGGAEDAPIGLGGAFVERPDGRVETDRDYHRGVLAGELPHDAQLAEWRAQALAAGWAEGTLCQGSCIALARPLCDALAASGALAYRQRFRTIVSEDLLLAILAYAHGFRAASLGGPRGPVAIANKHLPLPLSELVDPASRWLIAHSTKVGLDGETEPEIRAAAAAARASWPAT